MIAKNGAFATAGAEEVSPSRGLSRGAYQPRFGRRVRGMRHARAGNMDHFLYAMKRAYYGTLRVVRAPAASKGVTPARFDVMYAIHGAYEGQIHQAALARKVGVSVPVVARMLRSLEEQGYVLRERCRIDRRKVIVALTKAGQRCFRRARLALMCSGLVDLAIDSALGEERWFDEAHTLVEKSRLDHALTRLREAFWAGGKLYYPWHPED
jgi:DNA-binding MarR family transcriptional regulator